MSECCYALETQRGGRTYITFVSRGGQLKGVRLCRCAADKLLLFVADVLGRVVEGLTDTTHNEVLVVPTVLV